ncbi:beta-lactamase [Bacillus sp. SA1-12]|uniref:MBL fold metallo-hydrolase n=1 Tax=Bacillus sp. SA1-12 TaxID=1455638 RepID=UPI00062689D7|nr:MBL fold metallo-hydrolase [Bacillus sp. SA1-12]KKI93866.1 beta-lactamase [Bacillus sp. SA1-12]
MAYINTIDERISIIDSLDLGMQGRTSCYVLQDEKVVLFEPSASPSIPHLLDGLAELYIPLEKIAFIIVTHIHLDHAGGAGLLLEKCQNAKLIVHPKGAKHMIDPSRLISGARAVYKNEFDRLFHPIIPVPEHRLLIKKHGEKIKIGNNSYLTFFDSPGHANHHFSIHDSVSNGIFTGDTVGIYYKDLLDQGIEFYLPSTSPNQFNPEAMLASVKMIDELQIDKIYFSHFGMSCHPKIVYSELRKWLPKFVDTAQKVVEKGKDTSFEECSKAVETELKSLVFNELLEQNIVIVDSVYDMLKLDLSVSAMGLVDYLRKNPNKG